MTTPTPPIAFGGPIAARWPSVEVPDAVVRRLATLCPTSSAPEALAEAGRDWWPLTIRWALTGGVPALPAVVATPSSADQVAAVLRVCNEARVPVTAAAGRSGVCGASVPVFGGVALDLTGLAGIDDIDDRSLLVRVRPGTFGDVFERDLHAAGLTLGHWPQSIELSTVGGWIACRSAGQYSTRYGKIEDMVRGLSVVLADGTAVDTGGRAPRAASGPDLTQLFVGSEGVLGVITSAVLRVHPAPSGDRRGVWGFPTFHAGLDACRRILRRGGQPAVLRLYDEAESMRSFATESNVMIVLDEGDPAIVDAAMAIVGDECGDPDLDDRLVARWMEHRNDVSALAALVQRGFVLDTIEIAARWDALPGIYDAAVAALRAVPGVVAASAHQSHAYTDGACLYFTWAAQPPEGADPDAIYVQAWDAVTNVTLDRGGALSHHHGVGLNRARFMEATLGAGAMDVLRALKRALDPNGILNPGKLGLPSPFGPSPWP